MRAFLNLKKLKKEEKFKSWLCKIALNLAKKEYKRRKAMEEKSLENYGFFYLENENKEKKKSIIINEALNKLKFKDKFILSLFYYNGFSLKEIEELSGIKEDNLKMILCRAMQKLRKNLEGYEYELLS